MFSRYVKVAIAFYSVWFAAEPFLKAQEAHDPGFEIRTELGPDSFPQENVPKGKLEGPFLFRSKIIENTIRQYWIFVPAQYTKEEPASLLVFQDGQRATNPKGSLQVPRVLENLIAKKAIPVTIGIFITPGHRGSEYPDDLGMSNPNHRAQEYDALGDRYARFLIEEMLPEVGKTYNLTKDPDQRAIGGTSSGAICAFTVAWERPDAFRKVISCIGSYTSIGYRAVRDGNPMVPGGDLYPTLIRRSPCKPISIFFQDGSNDLDNRFGNWFLANQRMVAALHYANAQAGRPSRRRGGPPREDNGIRYRLNHAWTDGEHSDAHGGAMLPDILRWLWKSDE